ncbi:hypothetical protein MVEN_01135300 [Mycena venus]|uniref:Uncharacterized protein n=1 Tax=Mycena venus TaxID=2733690 RepID=A0A8H7D0B0_9AGAR|nr:hypothetical protein MVEN_01135300 [Mycena venus]
MPPARAASKSISSSISTLAAKDLASSDDEMDLTLVNSDNDEDSYDSDLHRDDEDSEDECSEEEEEEEEEEDEDNEEEEDGDEPIVLGKRKRGRPAKKPDATADSLPTPRQIEYTTSIYTPDQIAMPRGSRGPPVSEIFSFKSTEPWPVVKSRIRHNIKTALNLTAPIDLDDYNVFTKKLVSNALKIKTHPAAKIIVEPKAASASADKENDDKAKGKKGGKKTKVPNARDILPGNVALNDKIAAIREKWKCPGVTLTLKGEEFATINKPPNNELFDKLDLRALAARSPLLHRRLELNQQKAAAVNNTPQININFPPELVGLFGRPAAPDPAPAAAATPATVPRAAPASDVPMLISPGVDCGPSLSIEAFCALYDLDDDICARFKQFKFKKTDSFRYISLHQLDKMEFMAGEVAELQVAIAKWTVPVV